MQPAARPLQRCSKTTTGGFDALEMNAGLAFRRPFGAIRAGRLLQGLAGRHFIAYLRGSFSNSIHTVRRRLIAAPRNEVVTWLSPRTA